jgi:hypothetical protein
MDTLGFALENFDAIGQWRTQDGKFPVDNTGSLPNGQTVQGPDGLKAVLKSDRDAFTRCLAEKLLTYGLGRGLEPSDQPVVRTIAQKVAADDYRFSRLVLEIVNSPPFQMRSAAMRRVAPTFRRENAKGAKTRNPGEHKDTKNTKVSQRLGMDRLRLSEAGSFSSRPS